MNGIRLLPAGSCPASRDALPHTWQAGDNAELIAYGQPDYAIAFYLGRCRHCGTALLLLAPLAAEDPAAAALYEAHGARL